jgi:hypothetical protein
MHQKMSVLRRAKTPVRAATPTGAHKGFDYPMTSVGSAGGVEVAYDARIGNAVQQLAEACLAEVAHDAAKLWSFFQGVTPVPSKFLIAPLSNQHDGSGGAYHYGCAATDLYCDADLVNPNGQQRTSALFCAELSEVGQATQGKGWDCGASHGEGLSRFHAELIYPGALDDYASFPSWLDGGRNNWVDRTDPTDQNYDSTGCATGFLFWLLSLGYSPEQITAAAAPTLAGVYSILTGKKTAWADFSTACQANWPKGRASNVQTDNPWQAAPPPPPPPPPPPAPPTGGIMMTLAADLTAGKYVVVPSELPGGKNAISFSQILQIVLLILGALQGGPLTQAQWYALFLEILAILGIPAPVPLKTQVTSKPRA